MKFKPLHCRPEAFYFFAEQIPQIETTSGLLRAAVAISMHALDDVDPMDVDRRISSLADRVRGRVRSQRTEAILAHLHDVLFDEVGFRGNRANYYLPLNSYIPAVLETRLGIPVTLALLYKVVGERCGLQVTGISAPCHFLAAVQANSQRTIIDPFCGGCVLDEDEVFQHIEQMTGRTIAPDVRFLEPTSHALWVSRMIANLQNIFAATERRDDLAAMTELQSLLSSSSR